MAKKDSGTTRQARPTPRQLAYLRRGLDQPGGKLPLFDEDGQRIDPRTVRACLAHGWAETWTRNPIKPDWLICRLTEAGRRIARESAGRPHMTAAATRDSCAGDGGKGGADRKRMPPSD